MMGVLISAALGGAFCWIGRWGRRNAPSLVSPSLTASSQQAQARSLRRGAMTCLIAGGLFLAFTAVQLVDLTLHI